MTIALTSVPASPGQHGIWITEQVGAAGSAYAMPVLIRFDGKLDTAALAAACAAVVARHPALGSAVADRAGELWLVPAAEQPALRVVDRAGPAGAAAGGGPGTGGRGVAEPAVDGPVGAEVRRPFDLRRGPLIRFTLFAPAPGQYLLAAVAHHLVFDGSSKDVLVRDLAAAYNARVAGAADPAAGRSADGPAAEPGAPVTAAAPEPAARAAAEAYYAGRWADPGEVLLPGLRTWSRSAQPGEDVRFDLDGPLRAELAAAADRLGVTRFELLLAALQALLHRYGNPDVTVAVDLGTRSAAQRDVVGMFVNELPVLTGPAAGAAFGAFAQAVRAELAHLYRHRSVPLGQAVAGLTPRVGITPVTFSYRRRGGEPAFTGVRAAVEWMAPNYAARNALHLQVVDGPEQTSVSLQYSPAALDRCDAARVAGHFATLLRSVLADPMVPVGRAELLPAAERTLLRDTWNATAVERPAPATVVSLVAERAAATPDAVAVVAAGRRLRYAELDAAATRLAHRLRDRGVGAGALVAVCGPRSADLLVGLLAVAKAGAGYLPLDPGYPTERLAYLLGDAGPALVLTAGATPAGLAGLAGAAPVVAIDGAAEPAPAGRPPAAPPAPLPLPAPADLAYLLYTSGSTGRPKGVEVEHRALANLLLGLRDTLGATAADTWLGLTSLSFDIAALELYLPLITGGRLVLADEAAAHDGAGLARLIAAERVTHVQATPSGWRVLLDAEAAQPAGDTGGAGGAGAGGAGAPIAVGLVGGEALPVPLARELAGRVGRLVNVYGPTETTIWSTAAQLAGSPEHVTIGRPIANTRVHVVDAELELLPVGVPGELVIGGAGLARGYRGQPGLTASRFVPDPHGPPGARLYRTGDRARRRADGELEFLGRIDDQVKIRGHRVELAEIEARLAEHPAVARAAAAVRPDERGEPLLVAYVVARPGPPPAAAQLREHLAGWLPAALVPGPVVVLDRLPLTPNGKLDRAALPAPPPGTPPPSPQPPGAQPPGPAGSELVAAIQEIWQDVLRIEQIGPEEDLFDLGGHSLTMIRITARIKRGHGVEVPMDVFFETPTISGVTAAVADLLAGQGAGG